MSLHMAKHFGRTLARASAVLVIHVGAATAADSTGDVQQKMQELLTGTTATHIATQIGLRNEKVTSRTADAQELVKQLLLGTSASPGEAAASVSHSEAAKASVQDAPQERRAAYVDTQAAAVRQLLLGQR